jgi:hypothetical protein
MRTITVKEKREYTNRYGSTFDTNERVTEMTTRDLVDNGVDLLNAIALIAGEFRKVATPSIWTKMDTEDHQGGMWESERYTYERV